MVLPERLHGIVIHLSFIDEVDSICEKRRFPRVNIRCIGGLTRERSSGKVVDNLMIVYRR